jgi:Tfp pilus assembly protein PilO
VKKSQIGTIIAMVIPIACAIVLGLMSLGQYKRSQLAVQNEQQQQQSVNSLQRMMQTVDIDPLMDKKYALYATADEQAQFLTQLRINAQGAGVKLTQYTNMGEVLPPRPQNGQPAQERSTYRPVASTLTVQGPYDGVRNFAYSLLRSDRLINMNGVTWKRDSGGTTSTLSFTLIRYVMDPETTATTTAAGATPVSSGGA